jgi:aryl-alcohol dehydrogenase-like predicted oxidoreductase
MQHRFLGRSGLKVSEISYGNWITHGSQVEEDAALACVRAALDAGITTFDTADVYAGGRAEQVLGRALAGERRDGLEIFTKVYWPTGEGQNDRGLSRKHILRNIERSLQHLQTDYVDLLQAHRYDHETPLEETLRAFDDLVRAGKVLYVGVSEWSASQIRDAIHIAEQMGFDRLVSNQPQYSALYRVIEAEVVPTCEELGLSQVVWSPIAQGVLTGKYLPGQPPPAGSRATDEKSGANIIKRLTTPQIQTAVQDLRPIAADCGMSMAQLAVAWVLQTDNVASAIVGATRPEQVVDNVQASGVELDDDTMAAIDKALADVILTDPSLTKSPERRP